MLNIFRKSPSPNSDQSAHLSTSHLIGKLKKISIQSGVITISNQGIIFILKIFSTMILARLLTPTDYGIIGMVFVFTGFLNIFKDLGLSLATIQKEEISQEEVSSLFYINILIGICFMLIVMNLGNLVAWFFSEPKLKSIMFYLSFTFLLSGISIQHLAILKRQMKFGLLATIETLSLLFASVVGVVAAFSDLHYWSLVLMYISLTFFTALFSWIFCRWRPDILFSFKSVKNSLLFGGHLSGFNIINYFAKNFDNLLIGKVLGPQQLGFYTKAYQLLLLPVQQINSPITNVAIPTLSRIQGDHLKFSAYYYKAIRIIASLSFPFIIFLAISSEEIIILILGEQWIIASQIFRVLAFAAIAQSIGSTTGWIYISLGRTKRMLIWSIISVPIIITSFIIGVKWGALGVAISYTISIYALIIPAFLFAFHNTHLNVFNLLDTLKYPALMSIGIFLTTLLVHSYIKGPNHLKTLFGSGLVFIVVYILFIFGIKTIREDFMDIISKLSLL